MDSTGKFLLTMTWITGIVIAKGFWSTLFAIAIPPWAWYLLIERVLTHFPL